jgi:ribosome-associated translation inhibitor RaiA
MVLPLQITFRQMRPSEAVAARIRSEVSKLDHYYGRITSCRVAVEAPHRHHKRGVEFHIVIHLGLPREEIVIKHAPSLHKVMARNEAQKWIKHLETGATHRDVYVTIRDAFKAARRRLEDYARRLRGDVKVHASGPACSRC